MFVLRVFRGSFLSNLLGFFQILSILFYFFIFYFFRVCSEAFLSLVILLISAGLRGQFSYSSRGFLVGLLLPRFLLHGSVLSSTQ